MLRYQLMFQYEVTNVTIFTSEGSEHEYRDEAQGFR